MVEKATGERPRHLDLHLCPPALAYLWRWFCELSRGRQPGAMGGLMPLGWQEMAAWASLSGNKPTSSDIAVIKRIDDIYLESTTKGGGHGSSDRH
ncbi:MAG: phage tail assembly chaperone [Caulobacter sp.]